jgi:hypothetical protein
MCFEKRADNRVETLCIMPLLLLLLCIFFIQKAAPYQPLKHRQQQE